MGDKRQIEPDSFNKSLHAFQKEFGSIKNHLISGLCAKPPIKRKSFKLKSAEAGKRISGNQKRFSRKKSKIDDGGDFEFTSTNKTCAPYSEIDVNQIASGNMLKIPSRYRPLFMTKLSQFNKVQETVMDKALFSSDSLVVCAPTGSGKTTIFEMAIVKMLVDNGDDTSQCCCLYLAPTKSLCHERFTDWTRRFSVASMNLLTNQVTGDSNEQDLVGIDKSNLIFSTPEKWDSLTRRFNNSNPLNRRLQLVMIDEIHIINDKERGSTLEAVVTRMKVHLPHLRFVGVSATIPNSIDISNWLQTKFKPSIAFSFDQSYRPIRLKTLVLEFYYSPTWTDFRFDISLNYKLFGIIKTYCIGKSTLIFCGTRKGTCQAAAVLATNFPSIPKYVQLLNNRKIHDVKLRDMIAHGIAYHHAGLDLQDRVAVEEMFKCGDISILVATSTLAMGVNLPASAVIIKSTSYYSEGTHCDYNSSQLLQMIGRAGRPQFGEKDATVIIMTKTGTQKKYMRLLNGSETVESSLHTQLIEHVNAEIVLGTIRDLSDGISWVQSTFMFVRMAKEPSKYKEVFEDKIEGGSSVLKSVEALFLNCIQKLTDAGLVAQNEDGLCFQSTQLGMIMSKYCVSFETMKRLMQLSDDTTMSDLLMDLCQCSEIVSDILVRNNEKSVLNSFHTKYTTKTTKQTDSDGNQSNTIDNKTITTDQQRVRFTLKQKVKTSDMKCFTLIQACLGCLQINDFALNQETMRIMKTTNRLITAMYEGYVYQYGQMNKGDLVSSSSCLIHNICLLMKSIKFRIWYDSTHVLKQFPGIGQAISNAFVGAGVKNLESVSCLDPLRIEMIASRHPPFGHTLLNQVRSLPKLSISLQTQSSNNDSCQCLNVVVSLLNTQVVSNNPQVRNHSLVILVISTANNKLVMLRSIRICNLLPSGSYTICMDKPIGGTVTAKLINLSVVGLDASCEVSLPSIDSWDSVIESEKPDTRKRKRNQDVVAAAATKKTKAESKTIERYLQPMSSSSISYYFDHSLVWDENDATDSDAPQDTLNAIDESLFEPFDEDVENDQISDEIDDADLLKCAEDMDISDLVNESADLFDEFPQTEADSENQTGIPPKISQLYYGRCAVSNDDLTLCDSQANTISGSTFGINRNDVEKELNRPIASNFRSNAEAINRNIAAVVRPPPTDTNAFQNRTNTQTDEFSKMFLSLYGSGFKF